MKINKVWFSLLYLIFFRSFVFSDAEATNSRVAWASLGALVTCVAMAMVQIWNLKKFFVRKKLL